MHAGDQLKKKQMDGACSVYGRQERYIQDFGVETYERERPLGRPRRIWQDNIKMDLQAVGWGNLDWIDLPEDRDRWRALVNAVMNLLFP
jgi:hypothetical protein